MAQLINQVRKYWAIALIYARAQSAYRGSLILGAMMVGLRIWIFTQLYSATLTGVGSQQVSGFTLPMIIWMLMLVQSFDMATYPSMIIVMDDEIKSGQVVYALQRPYNYILYHYFGFLGRVFPLLMWNLVLGIAAALLLVGPISFSFPSLVCGAFVLFLGYILDFCMLFTFGICGFWIEEVRPFTWFYSKIKMILGGAIIPVALLPGAFGKIMLLLPFSNLYYTAAQLLVQFDSTLFVRCLAVQLVWILLLGMVVWYMYNKGVRHVTVSGG